MSIHSCLPSNQKRSKPFANLDGIGHRHRMRSKMLARGSSVLEDYEILEMLLYGVIVRKDTKPLAKQLLNHFSSFQAVCMADKQTLKEQFASEKFNSLIRFIRQIALRLEGKDILLHPYLRRWQDIIAYLTAHPSMTAASVKMSQDWFRILLLNGQYYLIRDLSLSVKGEELISAIIQKAIESCAMHMVIMHSLSDRFTAECRRKEAHFSLLLQSKARFYDLRVSAHILYNNEQYINIFE